MKFIFKMFFSEESLTLESQTVKWDRTILRFSPFIYDLLTVLPASDGGEEGGALINSLDSAPKPQPHTPAVLIVLRTCWPFLSSLSGTSCFVRVGSGNIKHSSFLT